MSAKLLLAPLAALVAAGCGGKPAAHETCSGVAVVITVTPPLDAGVPPDGGSDVGKPSCTGTCRDYLEALRVAIEAATPARCVRLTSGTSLRCVPSSTSAGCPANTVDEGRALEAQISDYLAASWPEIDTPLALDDCPCRITE